MRVTALSCWNSEEMCDRGHKITITFVRPTIVSSQCGHKDETDWEGSYRYTSKQKMYATARLRWREGCVCVCEGGPEGERKSQPRLFHAGRIARVRVTSVTMHIGRGKRGLIPTLATGTTQAPRTKRSVPRNTALYSVVQRGDAICPTRVPFHPPSLSLLSLLSLSLRLRLSLSFFLTHSFCPLYTSSCSSPFFSLFLSFFAASIYSSRRRRLMPRRPHLSRFPPVKISFASHTHAVISTLAYYIFPRRAPSFPPRFSFVLFFSGLTRSRDRSRINQVIQLVGVTRSRANTLARDRSRLR